MVKVSKFYPKDLIAIITLLACFLLKAIGIDSYIDIVIAVIVGYYFGRRIDGEGDPEKDLNPRVKYLENIRTITAKVPEVIKENKPVTNIAKAPLTTGDFKPLMPSH